MTRLHTCVQLSARVCTVYVLLQCTKCGISSAPLRNYLNILSIDFFVNFYKMISVTKSRCIFLFLHCLSLSHIRLPYIHERERLHARTHTSIILLVSAIIHCFHHKIINVFIRYLKGWYGEIYENKTKFKSKHKFHHQNGPC